jgi:hypothetical protein
MGGTHRAPEALATSGFRVVAVGEYSSDESTVPAASDSASALLRALVETLAPREQANLPALARAEAVDATARFVRDQLAALSAWLEFQVRLALWGFQAYSVLRHGRRFSHLAPGKRAAMIRAWSEGSFGPARQLIRLMRSVTFLGYFEQPAVLAALGTLRSEPRQRVSIERGAVVR